MAMFPNATRGYMPFVSGQHRPSTSKRGPRESRKKGTAKAYRVTLKDRQGFTYTYIIQADGTKSLPNLCGTKVTMNGQSLSLPDIDKYLANSKASRPAVDSGKKQGLFSSILKFLSNKTKSKSKRKPKPLPQRKRQRTISNISNLDPIQESPDEYEDEDSDDDAESSSYTHEEGSLQGDIESIHEDINTLILTQP